jgi:hypothetical protein
MKDILKKLSEANNPVDYENASNACLEYFATATEDERAQIRKVLLQKADKMLAESREYRQRAEELIAEYESRDVNIEIDGQKYPLSEWVTMKEYCRRFGLKNTMVLNNWINRNVIPKENILNISQLNNLRLIKAVPYKG